MSKEEFKTQMETVVSKLKGMPEFADKAVKKMLE